MPLPERARAGKGLPVYPASRFLRLEQGQCVLLLARDIGLLVFRLSTD